MVVEMCLRPEGSLGGQNIELAIKCGESHTQVEVATSTMTGNLCLEEIGVPQI